MRIITRSALFAVALLASVPTHADEASVNSAIDALLGDHVQYQAAIEAIIEAANSGDSETFAAYVSYPITVPVDGEPQTIETADDFVAQPAFALEHRVDFAEVSGGADQEHSLAQVSALAQPLQNAARGHSADQQQWDADHEE